MGAALISHGHSREAVYHYPLVTMLYLLEDIVERNSIPTDEKHGNKRRGSSKDATPDDVAGFAALLRGKQG